MAFYSEEQVQAILTEIDVQVVSDTPVVWMCYCPFHGNNNTPAFAVNKTTGQFFCFNEACGAYGELLDLITQLTDKSVFAAHRLIARAKTATPVDFSLLLEKTMEEEPMPTFSQTTLERMEQALWASQEAQDYLYGRKFKKETLEHYGIGYSPKRKMVSTPMHDLSGNPVGIIARSIKDKTFKNSPNLPRKRILWNLHRAKRQPKTVITEANFDSQRVWQATGIESVAILGSAFSHAHAAQLNKYFTHLVIMTDDDVKKPTFKDNCRPCREAGHTECIGHNTGLVLGQKIAEACRGINVSWAHLDSFKRYDGAKDAGDLTDEQIKYAIDNAISNVEMSRLVRV